MDDLISRREALDAVEHITSSMSICLNEDECHGMKRMQRQAILELANMPSASFENHDEIKSYSKDTISRQAAIDAIMGEPTDAHYPSWYAERLEQLPSVQRTGRWIWNKNGVDWGLGAWCCSECRTKAETWWATDEKYNPLMCSGGKFCGNCGARMDGDNG